MRRTEIVIFVFIFVVTIVAGALLGIRSSHRPATLDVSQSDLNLGKVWPEATIHASVPIQNRSSKRVLVKEIALSCNCARVTPTTAVIPARGRLKFDFEIMYSVDQPLSSQLDAVPFGFEFALLTDQVESTDYRWRVFGEVRRPLRFQSQRLNFNDTLVRGRPFKSKEIVAARNQGIKEVTAAFDPKALNVDVMGEGDRTRFSIVPCKNLPLGPFEYNVRTFGKGQQDRAVPTGTIKVCGNIVPDLVAFPSRVVFGPCAVGSNKTATVVVKSRSGHELNNIDVSCQSASVRIRDVTFDKHSATFAIHQHIVSEFEQSAAITIDGVVEDLSGPVAIQVNVEYFGVKRPGRNGSSAMRSLSYE